MVLAPLLLLLLHPLSSANAQEDESSLAGGLSFEQSPCGSECRTRLRVETCACLCNAWEHTQLDLTPLSARVARSTDDQGRTYVVKVCGVVEKEDLPSECRLDDGALPSVVRYSTGDLAGCETIGTVGRTAVRSFAGDTVDVVFSSEISNPPSECLQDLRGSRTFVLMLTPADSDQGPGTIQAAPSNYYRSDAPCDSYTAYWPTTVVAVVPEGDSSGTVNDGGCGEVNALYITGPFFAILATIGLTFVRKAKAGTANMPFGLPNMTAEQLSVFSMCYLTYVLYHALRAGFSGCKSSMASESGFTRAQMGNMDTGFLLMYGAGQFFWGSRADKVSPKITTVNGMYAIAGVVILYTLAEVVGMEPSVGFGALFFVVTRATEGFFQATGWSGTLAITSDWFGAAHRGAVMGVMSTNSNVGNIVGEIIVGSVFEVLPGAGGWQTALLILAGLLGAMGYINSRRLVYPPPLDFQLPAEQQQGIKDKKDGADLEGSDSSTGGANTEPIGIIEACKIPGVIPYALSYCFLKLVTYSLLFWLPFYLFEGAGLCKSLAALMATLNDVGMVAGGITAGWFSDILTHRAGMPVRTPIVVVGLLAAIVPIGLLTVSTSSAAIGILITLAGFCLGMPAECSTSAVCVDLAKSQPKAATATVIGIIDGTGALGAAAGQQMVRVQITNSCVHYNLTTASVVLVVCKVAYVSEHYGWEAVFNVLVVSLLFSAAMVSQMAARDFGYLKAAGNPQQECLQVSNAPYAPPVLDSVADEGGTTEIDGKSAPAGTQ